jgi:uncharacterized protein (DUF58 family)
MVLLGSIVAVCLLLFVLVFLFPRLSGRPQRGVDRSLETGRRASSHVPGRLGRWLQKPFTKSEGAADKSASAGRGERSRMPL